MNMNTTRTIINKATAFIILACSILLNYFCSTLSYVIVLPLYLDSLFTIGIVALLGCNPGIFCALCTNLLMSIFMHSPFLFCICHICTVFFSMLVFQKFKKNNAGVSYPIECFLWAGLWSAISNGILGNMIASAVYASNTGRPSATIVVQGIFCAIPNLEFANNFGGIIENIADKTLSSTVSFIFYKIVSRIKFFIEK